MKFSDLQTQEGFSNFFQQYHQQLTKEKSFPPLGNIKALNLASPIFGFKDWNAMAASNEWSKKEANRENSSVIMTFYYLDANILADEAGQIASTEDQHESSWLVFSSYKKANEYLWDYLAFNLKRVIKKGKTLEELRDFFTDRIRKNGETGEIHIDFMEAALAELEKIEIERSLEAGQSGIKERLEAVDLAGVHMRKNVLEDGVDLWFLLSSEDLLGVQIDYSENVVNDPLFWQ